jgi:hypothetical protein
VIFRPVGTPEWFSGPGPVSGRITVITELEAGTSYELAVFAMAADGSTSSQVGTTFATTDPIPDSTTTTTTTTSSSDGSIVPKFTG